MCFNKLTEKLEDIRAEIRSITWTINEIENLEKRDFKAEKEKLYKTKKDLDVEDKKTMNAIRRITGGKPCY